MNLHKRRCALMLFVFSTSAVLPAAVAPADACDLPQAAQDLLDECPGLQVYTEPETCDVSAFYGKPMTAGGTPDAAAAQWMADWGDATSNAFGIEDLDLRGVGSNGVGTNGLGSASFTVFRYQQFINTTGVEGASVRLLVLSGDPDRVVYVEAPDPRNRRRAV